MKYPYPEISMLSQYRKLFFLSCIYGCSSVLFPFVLLRQIPFEFEMDKNQVAAIIGLILMCITVISFLFKLHKRMKCPVCKGKRMGLVGLEYQPGDQALFYCQHCDQHYLSDLTYKQSLKGGANISLFSNKHKH